MEHVIQPVVFAALLWWIGTGVLLWLITRPKRTYKWTAAGVTVIAVVATWAQLTLRDDTSLRAAYIGFAAGVALWSWHEAMFLTGYISGPRKSPCPPGLSLWPRFRASTETVIYHEVAIAAHGGLIYLTSMGAPNEVAAWTFLLIWGMRISAKLVIFFGAPNISDAFMPSHLEYLKSYFQKRPFSAAAPLAIAAAGAVAAAIIVQASVAPRGEFSSISLILVSTLAALAVFEHLGLVMPLPDAALFKWALPARPPAVSKVDASEWRP